MMEPCPPQLSFHDPEPPRHRRRGARCRNPRTGHQPNRTTHPTRHHPHANGSLNDSQERAFERAKQTLRDAGARITHFTTDTSGRYRLEPLSAPATWNPTAEEFRLLNTELRG